MLNCLHSFCSSCLKMILLNGRITCPDCGETTMIDNVGDLPLDYTKLSHTSRSTRYLNHKTQRLGPNQFLDKGICEMFSYFYLSWRYRLEFSRKGSYQRTFWLIASYDWISNETPGNLVFFSYDTRSDPLALVQYWFKGSIIGYNW